MLLVSLKFGVLKLDKSSVTRLVHSANIFDVSERLEVSKFDKSTFFKERHL